MSSTQQSSRTRLILLLLGILAAVAFWHVAIRDASGDDAANASGLANVNAEDEEDFVTSMKSAINTFKLPDATDFGASAYDGAKPSLILHVGPIKTGVGALHEELLAKHKEALETDRFVLMPSTEGLHEACQNELSLVRQSYPNKKKQTKTVNQVLSEVPCWKSFLDALAPFYETGTSVIISDEQLSKQLLPNVHGIGPAVLDWITLRDTVMPDWNVVVVASYRRYYEWLPAAKAAAEQVHLQQHSASPPRLARWPGNREKGMLLEPLFPHFVRNAVEKLDVPYTPRLVDLYRPYVSQTKILNLYAKDQSVVSSFVCDILDAATTACAASRKRDTQQTTTATISEQSRMAILDAKADKDWSDKDWSDFQLFDELVTAAADHTVLRTKYVTRSIATATTQYYVEQYLHMQARDLPLSCPSADQSSQFLDESVAYEKTLLPDNNFYKAAAKEHRAAFDAVGTQFCSINMRAVLRQRHWRTFFRHLTNTSAVRIQAGGEPGPGRKLLSRLLRG